MALSPNTLSMALVLRSTLLITPFSYNRLSKLFGTLTLLFSGSSHSRLPALSLWFWPHTFSLGSPLMWLTAGFGPCFPSAPFVYLRSIRGPWSTGSLIPQIWWWYTGLQGPAATAYLMVERILEASNGLDRLPFSNSLRLNQDKTTKDLAWQSYQTFKGWSWLPSLQISPLLPLIFDFLSSSRPLSTWSCRSCFYYTYAISIRHSHHSLHLHDFGSELILVMQCIAL